MHAAPALLTPAGRWAVRSVSPISHLVQDGVLVRSGGRLRVSGRFLALAERVAAQAALQGRTGLEGSLELALRAHGYGGDPGTGARFLSEFMAERGQLGLLQPAFRWQAAVPA